MTTKRIFLFACLVWGLSSSLLAQHFSFNKFFDDNKDLFDSIVSNKEKYKLQILYTQIDRNEKQEPRFTTYSFDADKYYYYCASTIKLPAAIFALEKLNSLSKYHVTKEDSFSIENLSCDNLTDENLSIKKKRTCIDQLIKEMLLVSNNYAFNPLYDFITPELFNKRLHELGYKNAVVCRRFAGCDSLENLLTNPITFYDSFSVPKIKQDVVSAYDLKGYSGPLSPLIGKGNMKSGLLINAPFDFSRFNYIPLSNLHDLLQKIIFPDTVSKKLNLTRSDYKSLMKYMGMFPRESFYPEYNGDTFPDNYMKFFIGLDSGETHMPSNLRVFNKVGQAYGFITDCGYVEDTVNKVEFFLSASIYVNKNEILNDGIYEYDAIGFPFLHQLFNKIYETELLRNRAVKPKFRKFYFDEHFSEPKEEIEEKLDTEIPTIQLEEKKGKKHHKRKNRKK